MILLTNLDDPGSLSEIARAEFGITKNLPRSVMDAFEYLLNDQEMVSMLGETFVQSYLSVKKVKLTILV